ncbi:nucleoside 2-deoxyribosyltransferase [Oceanobacillus arenosus]|uniref:Nucleoside 2-deoxyribosyltransferase n=1 Tax=Oceanobacillus arenosus TaxID=1229153 RepID=A0A3D8PMK4_9BACI|nr:nucleoside 2-deoxyribosyltransferase [Oceanobacillus arenosus]RDW17333.1 nucleoside 2-deoxyribosyltransferase [Oceanobacillus arenosus]
MKAYLANGLFSAADQLFNNYLAGILREAIPELDLYVPQENEGINDKTRYADSVMIYEGDNAYLDDAEILIAIIDGIEIDSGVAAEIGRFIAMKELMRGNASRKVYALYTDSRIQGRENEEKVNALIADGTENQFMYRNLYVVGAIKKNGKILSDIDGLIVEIREDLKNK